MSRRVVIGILILLILGVLGGAVALIISRSRQQTTPTPTLAPSSFPQASSTPQVVQDPTGDPDADGLSNADEALWGTNPSNADTDSDGYKDGEEIAASHNPTIPSPNDKLPEGFQPGQNVTPLTSSAPAAQGFESFFSDSVDVTGGKQNITQEYARSIPDKDKTPLTLVQFVQTYPITTTLPQLNESAIITEQNVPLATSQYMSVAGNIDVISDRTRMSRALSDFLQDQNSSGFATLAARVTSFQKEVQALRVPPETRQYHKLMIGYCELLAGTFRQIAEYPNDQVKALVALRQLDAIDRQYYPILIQERGRILDLVQ